MNTRRYCILVFLSGYGAFRLVCTIQYYEYAPNPTYRAMWELDTGSGGVSRQSVKFKSQMSCPAYPELPGPFQ